MRVAIVGAGAAGMMAAVSVHEARPDAEVFLIERNDGLGKKVIISGGGRCNVTTGIQDVKKVLKAYPRGGKFLTTAMFNFPPEAVYGWFEFHGVALKTQEDLRVFPASDDGHDIVAVFERIFKVGGVKVMLKTTVTSVEKKSDQFLVHCKGTSAPLKVDVLVLTTGGQAYRQTGSTGDGYAFANALGHTITPLAPSLNAFFTKEKWPAQISGLSFEQAKITAKRKGSPHFTGPFLFTHKGVSGPAVFALSSLVAFEVYDAKHPLEITIDLFPTQKLDETREALETLMTKNPKKTFENVLGIFLPKSLADVALTETQVDGSKPANEIAKKDLQRVTTWLKAIPLTVIQRGAGDEFVTAGGVTLSEVGPTTMESNVTPGLYFAGEILDVDGYTGGFNLQASWATGRLAGEQIGRATIKNIDHT